MFLILSHIGASKPFQHQTIPSLHHLASAGFGGFILVLQCSNRLSLSRHPLRPVLEIGRKITEPRVHGESVGSLGISSLSFFAEQPVHINPQGIRVRRILQRAHKTPRRRRHRIKGHPLHRRSLTLIRVDLVFARRREYRVLARFQKPERGLVPLFPYFKTISNECFKKSCCSLGSPRIPERSETNRARDAVRSNLSLPLRLQQILP